MNWEEYLVQKKIDSVAFQKKEPEQFEVYKALFEQMHPNSFTYQKLFQINQIRRTYPLLKEEVEENSNKKKAVKPVFKPKTK